MRRIDPAGALRSRLRVDPPAPRTPAEYLKRWGIAFDAKPVSRVARPSVGIEVAYARKLLGLVDELNVSLRWFLRAAYRANEPATVALAQDDSPARAIAAVFRRLARRWQGRFDDAADELAGYFAKSVVKRSDTQLQKILLRGGLAVNFRLSRAANDMLQATIAENVSLIKSIASEHLTAVEGHVMRSVQAGHDLHMLTEVLEHQFGVARRRAEFIARDQNAKATGAIQKVRYQEAGITEAIWLHSGGGHVPRPTHVKAGRDRIRYKVSDGWYDPHVKQFIFPGQLPNCRCVSRPVLPGLKQP